VLEEGVVVGRIFFLDAVAPQGRPRMWASGRAAHGYFSRGLRSYSRRLVGCYPPVG